MKSILHDILTHSARCFTYTKNAKQYVLNNHLEIPETPGDVLDGWSVGGLEVAPSLVPFSSIGLLIRKSKRQWALVKKEISPVAKSLLEMSEEEIFNFTQIIIVTQADNGKEIPVFNRMRYCQEEVPEDDISKEKVRIPTDGMVEAEGIIHPLLGCYMSHSGIIFLWIDRIFATVKSYISGYLLFQKVLLHELIHAWLDCANRDSSLNVLLNKSPEWRDYEETLDNLLVLKCYESEKAFFKPIEFFIRTQPTAYRKAVDWYYSKEINGSNASVVSKIYGLIEYKLQPTHSINPLPIMSFIIGGDDIDEENYYIAEESVLIENSIDGGLYFEKKLSFSDTVVFSMHSSLHLFDEKGDEWKLTRLILTKTQDNVLVDQVSCSLHFVSGSGEKKRILYYKYLEQDVDKYFKHNLRRLEINNRIILPQGSLAPNPECLFDYKRSENPLFDILTLVYNDTRYNRHELPELIGSCCS